MDFVCLLTSVNDVLNYVFVHEAGKRYKYDDRTFLGRITTSFLMEIEKEKVSRNYFFKARNLRKGKKREKKKNTKKNPECFLALREKGIKKERKRE